MPVSLTGYITPLNAGFTGMVEDDQVIDTATTAGNIMVSDGSYFDSVAVGTDATLASNGALTIAADAITYAKMQNVTGTDKILGRETAGAGIVEEIACTAAGRAILDDVTAADQIVTLGISATAAELNVLDGVTAGTITASKAVVVDASRDIATLHDVTIDGTLTDGTLSIVGGEILDATTLEATTTLGIEIGDAQQLVLTDGKLNPTTDSDIDLGDGTHYFKDAYIDTITTTGALTIGSTIGCDTITVSVNNDVTLSGTGHITSGSEGFIVGTLTITDGSIDDTDGTIDFGATALTNIGAITTTGVLSLPDGSAAAPSVLWATNIDAGFFKSASGVLSVSSGGIERAAFSSSAIYNYTPVFDCYRFSDIDVLANSFQFKRAKGARGAATACTSGNVLGTLGFYGNIVDEPPNYSGGVNIKGIANENFSAGNAGSRMEFYTTPDGSATPVERMTIEASGAVNLTGNLLVDTITEATGAAGVTIEGVQLKDSTILLDPTDTDTYIYHRIANTVSFVVGGVIGVEAHNHATGGLTCVIPYGITAGNNVNDANPGKIRGSRYRPGAANDGRVQGADGVASFLARGWTGAAYVEGCSIDMIAVGDWTATSYGSKIEFKTTASGATALTTQMTIGDDGGVHIPNMKSGTDQADAGAAAGELYFDTNDDDTVKMGV